MRSRFAREAATPSRCSTRFGVSPKISAMIKPIGYDPISKAVASSAVVDVSAAGFGLAVVLGTRDAAGAGDAVPATPGDASTGALASGATDAAGAGDAVPATPGDASTGAPAVGAGLWAVLFCGDRTSPSVDPASEAISTTPMTAAIPDSNGVWLSRALSRP